MKAFRALTLNFVRSGMRNRVALFFTLGLATYSCGAPPAATSLPSTDAA